jgi:hypothetical protein
VEDVIPHEEHDQFVRVVLYDGLRVRPQAWNGQGRKMGGGGIHGKDQIDFDPYA